MVVSRLGHFWFSHILGIIIPWPIELYFSEGFKLQNANDIPCIQISISVASSGSHPTSLLSDYQAMRWFHFLHALRETSQMTEQKYMHIYIIYTYIHIYIYIIYTLYIYIYIDIGCPLGLWFQHSFNLGCRRLCHRTVAAGGRGSLDGSHGRLGQWNSHREMKVFVGKS